MQITIKVFLRVLRDSSVFSVVMIIMYISDAQPLSDFFNIKPRH
jgi:hypothetical protein